MSPDEHPTPNTQHRSSLDCPSHLSRRLERDAEPGFLARREALDHLEVLEGDAAGDRGVPSVVGCPAIDANPQIELRRAEVLAPDRIRVLTQAV